MNTFSDMLIKGIRALLGIQEVWLLPGLHKVIMRVASLIEYKIYLPSYTASQISDLIKRFLNSQGIPYSESDGTICLEYPTLSERPRFLLGEDGYTSFFAASGWTETARNRWDGLLTKLKRAL